jgi:hypothetical protein
MVHTKIAGERAKPSGKGIQKMTNPEIVKFIINHGSIDAKRKLATLGVAAKRSDLAGIMYLFAAGRTKIREAGGSVRVPGTIRTPNRAARVIQRRWMKTHRVRPAMYSTNGWMSANSNSNRSNRSANAYNYPNNSPKAQKPRGFRNQNNAVDPLKTLRNRKTTSKSVAQKTKMLLKQFSPQKPGNSKRTIPKPKRVFVSYLPPGTLMEKAIKVRDKLMKNVSANLSPKERAKLANKKYKEALANLPREIAVARKPSPMYLARSMLRSPPKLTKPIKETVKEVINEMKRRGFVKKPSPKFSEKWNGTKIPAVIERKRKTPPRSSPKTSPKSPHRPKYMTLAQMKNKYK